MNDEISDETIVESNEVENEIEKTTSKKNNFVLYLIIFVAIIGGLLFFNKKELRPISMDEIGTHNSKDSCWTSINDGVYNVTKFVSVHKGGDKILAVCGIDGTDLFTGKSPMGRVHSEVAVKLLSSMKIGTLQK